MASRTIDLSVRPGERGSPPGGAPLPDQRTAHHRNTVMQLTWSLVAGGAEIYALTIASNLDSDRYRPLMCGIDQGGALEPEIARRGIPHFVMNRRNGIDWKLMWRLYRLFRELKVRTIHTHHFNQLFYSILPARLLGIRVIHTEHSIECYKKRRLRIAMRLLSALCDKVTAIGADGEQVLRDRVGVPARKLTVIRAGVRMEDFQVERAEARRLLGIPEHDRVAVIVARLSSEKNHHLLLAAFSDVLRDIPDARLLMAGDGVYREAVEQEVRRLGLQQRVQVLGVRRDISQLLAACDLFVLSSDREGLPIAVLEAMAAARPVVSTAVGDLPEVVQDGRTGRLVPAKDRAALAAALREVLSDAALAQRMGAAGRAVVEQHYAVRHMVARHEALYDGQ
jgi:L-malate glycosyltransferase